MSTITTPVTLTAVSSTAFGIPVANQLNQQLDFLTFVPGATTNSPASGTATWLTLGTFTVPTWATKARLTVVVYAAGAVATGASANLALKLGTVVGNNHLSPSTNGTGRYPIPLTDLLTGISTGSQSLVIQATFVASQLVADGSSRVDALVDYLG